jgi:sulfoxide reductase catalytic subunit YedY
LPALTVFVTCSAKEAKMSTRRQFLNRMLKIIAAAGATHLVVSGPAAAYEKRERFEMAEIENDKLFLAYAVNGVPLPQKHGYPLRLVAEDHYGSRWAKYVEKIEIQKVQNR